MNYKDFFKDKKIAVIGLGVHGEMIPDIKFLFKQKSNVSLYDPRSESSVKSFFLDLAEIALFRYTFGSIPSDELCEADLIILSPSLSRDSSFLSKAKEKGIPIEYPDTLFIKLAPAITLLSIIGVCGKTTVLHMTESILRNAFQGNEDQGIFTLDPEEYGGSLVNLRRVKKGDLIIARIPEELYEAYEETGVSPHVAVITSLPHDVANRSSALNLLSRQTYNNFIIAPDGVIDMVKAGMPIPPKAKLLRTRPSSVSNDWVISWKGKHEKENAALAIETAKLFKVSPEIIQESMETYTGIKYRLEPIKKGGGTVIYNDASSIGPRSTISAIKSLSTPDMKISLIIGGSFTGYPGSSKEDYLELISNIKKYVHTLIIMPGSGPLSIRKELKDLYDTEDLLILQAKDMSDAIALARENSKKGDTILYSPAFGPGGVYKSRKERGEAFILNLRKSSKL